MDIGADQIHFEVGKGAPLGVHKAKKGLNFSLFSKESSRVSLCIFLDEQLEIPMHRQDDLWTLYVEGLPDKFNYLFLLNDGVPFLDPYGKRVHRNHGYYSRYEKKKAFNWEGISRPLIPFEDLIIYEMHVRGFTQDASSEVKHPGTYLGLIEKIPYLKELGINAVELMPVYAFDESEHPIETLHNYWGYDPMSFFSPMNWYAEVDPIREFKEMVKALHREGIEVILDVVYNHTSKHGLQGPDNKTYYHLDDAGNYMNFSGCGNTINCNHERVQDLILSSLRYWVTEFHVDGFRFDLASVLTREEGGAPLGNPPLVEKITKDPLLFQTKLIAEPWDVGGLYHVGSFPSWKWAEWNGQYRDQIRRFIKGEKSHELISSLLGSPHLYHNHKKPYHSINFITSHDGFTLRDLTSYHEKQNILNREENRDGNNCNESWNCGIEGVTEDPEILTLRMRQMANYFFALFTSIGTPMFLMGDEYGHTRYGNNNAWCQDNKLNYFLWDQTSPLLPFVKALIHFRKNSKALQRKEFANDVAIELDDKAIAYTLDNLYIAYNPTPKVIELQLPKADWRLEFDTYELKYSDKSNVRSRYKLHPHSAILLQSSLDV